MTGKEEVKLFLFTDNMIFYIKKIKNQNSRNLPKKPS